MARKPTIQSTLAHNCSFLAPVLLLMLLNRSTVSTFSLFSQPSNSIHTRSIRITAAVVTGASMAFVPLTRVRAISNNNEDDSMRTPDITQVTTAKVHLIVLVHGWLGNDSELGYIEETLIKETKDDPRFNIFSAKCNIGRTHDGIAAGGERLAAEITERINILHSSYDKAHLSLSFIGNSLGGLYARYSLSKLDWTLAHPLVFCTTATPHLGVSKHTYLPIPRWAEWGVVQVIDKMKSSRNLKADRKSVTGASRPTNSEDSNNDNGSNKKEQKDGNEEVNKDANVTDSISGSTGQDLFRYTDILLRMATSPEFTDPLKKFGKRLAYANAFMTDFQVPTTTAAFLSPNSDYPHETSVEPSVLPAFFALKVETPQDQTIYDESCLSQNLDALGWTKIFCDVREDIPVPSLKIPGRNPSVVPSQPVWTSKGLIPIVASVGDRFHIPLGHTVMVANSKSDMYAKINSQGRKVVDRLSADLVQNILELEQTHEEQEKWFDAKDGAEEEESTQDGTDDENKCNIT